MRAAVYDETGPPEVLRTEEVKDPTCTDDGVVIDVEAISIEGGDVGHRARGEMASRPHIVGYQCAGAIREIGKDVVDRDVGQRVVAIMMHGSHAEKVAVPALATWAVPDELDLRRASCVPIPFGTADDCLFEFGRLQAGESVLIHAGAGGVGLASIQLAKRAGATVLATASSPEKLEKLKAFGLDHGINYRELDFPAAAREITGGRGVDLIVDSIGGHTLEKSIEALAYRGRIAFGGSRRLPARLGRTPSRQQDRDWNLPGRGVCSPARARTRNDSTAPRRRGPGRARGRDRPRIPADRGGGGARSRREPPRVRPCLVDSLGL